MRAAHDRRAAEVLSVMDHANPEAGGIDVIAQLLTMIYVRGF